MAARVVADHPPPGPHQWAGIERPCRVVGAATPGETVEADDERPGALVVVGDPHTAHQGVHEIHSPDAELPGDERLRGSRQIGDRIAAHEVRRSA